MRNTANLLALWWLTIRGRRCDVPLVPVRPRCRGRAISCTKLLWIRLQTCEAHTMEPFPYRRDGPTEVWAAAEMRYGAKRPLVDRPRDQA